MNPCGIYLKEHAAELARETAASTDTEEQVALFERLVRKWAECMESERALDLSELEALEGRQGSFRTLRTLEATCIEALRQALPPTSYREGIVYLRRCVRRSIHLHGLDRQDYAFYQELLEGPARVDDPRYGRLLAFFRGVMSSLRNLVFVYDVHGNLLYVNDTFLTLLNFSEDDLRNGLSVYDFILPQYTDLIETFIESPGSVMRAPFTVEAYTSDGQRVPLELTTEPIMQGEEICALLGLARDLRLERRLEEEIRRSNAYLDTVLANVPVGVIVLDEHGAVTDANTAAATLAGAHVAGDIVGQRLEQLFDPQDETSAAALKEIADTYEPLHCCYRGKTRFGTEINCDVRSVPLPQKTAKAGSRLLLIVDLTDQLALQESLIRSEKLKALGMVMAGVAHELNNPLTGILGFSQLVLASQDLSPSLAEHVDHIRLEAERCKRIVEELQSFAQRRPPHKGPCLVNGLLAEVVSLCEYQIGLDGIEVQLTTQRDLPPLQADAQALERVFLNILNNAHEALRGVEARERRIAITSTLQDKQVRIVFADNGPGIRQEHLRRVFDPFFTTKDIGEGIGLGLSVAYGIVRDHGGDLSVESVPGEGTTVSVVLPVT
jgi:two-component system NtrC family sensor kinase